MNPTKNEEKQTDRFTLENTMQEVLTVEPNLGMVLMRDFHVGGCRNCGFNANDTIEQVAQQNGIPADRLLEALNRGV